MKPPGRQLIGTTSWLVPGTYYENARLVSQLVDFVELLIYRWDGPTHKLLLEEVDKLRRLTERHGLLYTVHLPTERLDEVVAALEFFDSELHVIGYVVHPIDEPDFEKLVLGHERVAVENLMDTFRVHRRTVFDVGHHLNGVKVNGDFLENTVELHLMGVEGGLDHRELNLETLERVWETLGTRLLEVPLICFEVFDLAQLIRSMVVWERWKKRRDLEV